MTIINVLTFNLKTNFWST